MAETISIAKDKLVTRLEAAFQRLREDTQAAEKESKDFIPSINQNGILIFNIPYQDLEEKFEDFSQREKLSKYHLSQQMVEYICRDRIYVDR